MGNKFNKGIVTEIKQNQAEAVRQERIKQKYNIDVPDNVVVVEKNNMLKFTVKTVISAIKLIATILLVVLAFVGLISLIYPTSRHDLLMIFQDIQNQLSTYINL